MGGGPVEGEDESPDVSVHSQPVLAAGANHVVYGSEANVQERQCPVLTTVATGGLVGGVLGSFLGMGSILGTTAGAFAGASIASRDDAIGANTRQQALALKNNVEGKLTKAFDRINEEPLGRDITGKISTAFQVMIETGERYKIGEKVETAALKVVQVAEPKVRMIREKVAEADTNGYLDRAAGIWQQVDQATGFTRSVEAVKRELKC